MFKVIDNEARRYCVCTVFIYFCWKKTKRQLGSQTAFRWKYILEKCLVYRFALLHNMFILHVPDIVKRHKMQLQTNFISKKESFLRPSMKKKSLKGGFCSHDHSHFRFDYSRFFDAWESESVESKTKSLQFN